jgi:hypothetical protein
VYDVARISKMSSFSAILLSAAFTFFIFISWLDIKLRSEEKKQFAALQKAVWDMVKEMSVKDSIKELVQTEAWKNLKSVLKKELEG